MPRSSILHGFFRTIRSPRPLLWAYVANAAAAWLLSFGLRTQYSNVVANSLASQRLIGGFDLGVALDASRRLGDGPAGSLTPSFFAIPVYLLIFFLLVPGTLLTYQSASRIHLGTLLQTGIQSFWSFVRIVLLTALIAAPTLGILAAIQTAWSKHIDKTITGRPAVLLQLIGVAIIFLAASAIRLFFDLVEIHTVSLAQTLRPTGRPDRRVRKTLRPALATFRAHFLPTYLTFVVLALLGAAAVWFFTMSALHHLAQPRVWPTLLLAQTGVFLLLFTRFWQRAAETVHFQNINPTLIRSNIFVSHSPRANPAPPPPLQPSMSAYASSFPTPDPVNPISPILPCPDSNPIPDPDPGIVNPFPGLDPDPVAARSLDAVPNPEPAAPSLDTPDPAVFHHDVSKKDLLN